MLPIADKWFEHKKIDDDITLFWEPHVARIVQCNCWHIRGRDRDLMIDTGMGIASLSDAARHLFDKTVTAVATHTHLDHIGSHHEFQRTLVHELEAENLRSPEWRGTLTRAGLAAELGEHFCAVCDEVGYGFGDQMITALPYEGYDVNSYSLKDAPVTEIVKEGDVIDLGNRAFEVLHLPGHSPGSIGLWEAKTGTLFSGDTIYDGPLLDDVGGSDVKSYVETMKRLRQLPVNVVHAGHDPSFGRERMIQIIDAYLATRA
jgi:glyoxylase-like metal-dependent hydrolase (beta-lactamase superfamily II)